MEHRRIISHSIVFVGRGFAPTEMRPATLLDKRLITPDEASHAQLDMILPSDVSFVVGDYEILCDRTRLQVTSSNASEPSLVREFATSLLSEFHESATVSAVGINRDAHFEVATEEEWHAIGHRFAPPEAWGTIMGRKGLLNLTILDQERGYGGDGYFRLTLQPSTKLHPGIFISTNDNLDVSEGDSEPQSSIDRLHSAWNQAQEKSEAAIQAIIG